MKYFLLLLGLFPLLTVGENPFADKEKIKDGACAEYKQAAEIDAAWLQEVKTKGLYYQMGSRYWFYTITSSVTGQPPTEASPAIACLSNTAGKDSFIYRGYGGNTADYKCALNPDEKKECFPTDRSTNILWAAKRGTSEATFVWMSSDKQWLLGFRCSGQQKVWSLRSTSRLDLDPTIKQTVLDYVKSQGFNPENAVILPQANCPDAEPYPEA